MNKLSRKVAVVTGATHATVAEHLAQLCRLMPGIVSGVSRAALSTRNPTTEVKVGHTSCCRQRSR